MQLFLAQNPSLALPAAATALAALLFVALLEGGGVGVLAADVVGFLDAIEADDPAVEREGGS